MTSRSGSESPYHDQMISTAVHVLAFVAGVGLFAGTVMAIVNGMLVPRPRRSRIAHLANHLTNRTFRMLAMHRSSFEGRDERLAAAGPTAVLVQLLFFVVSFVAAFALMMFGVSNLDAGAAIYQSGSTLFTLGFVEPVNPAQVGLSFLAAFTGLAVVAILIGYLLTLYSAYTERELGLTALSLSAGEPAWGPELICRANLIVGENVNAHDDLGHWVSWVTSVRTAQTANPVLNQYRSVSTHRSWVIGLLALLDAAALSLTTVVDDRPTPGVVRLLSEGTQTLTLLVGHALFRAGALDEWQLSKTRMEQLPSGIDTGQRAVVKAMAQDANRAASRLLRGAPRRYTTQPDPGITREEFDAACIIMQRAGVKLVDDLETAWTEFQEVRSQYWPSAVKLANQFYAVQAPWSGLRSPATVTVWPSLAADQLPG